jgi:hypothetical protein
MNDLEVVYVYCTGNQYSEMPSFMSDDCEVRKTGFCPSCDSELQIHYGEPFASCECGTQEWYQ